mgnify:CR=1 FL=1
MKRPLSRLLLLAAGATFLSPVASGASAPSGRPASARISLTLESGFTGQTDLEARGAAAGGVSVFQTSARINMPLPPLSAQWFPGVSLRYRHHRLDREAGTPLPADACTDSFDVSGALLGKPGAKGREHYVQQDNGGTGNFGFRVGNWKLVRYETKFANNEIVEQPLQRTPAPQFQLFDLAKDPGEQTDVFAKNPEVGEKLKARLAAIVAAPRSR